MEGDAFRVARIELDERSFLRRSPDVEHERAVAIADLLDANSFAPANHPGGPYALRLSIEENRLAIDVALAAGGDVDRLVLPREGLAALGNHGWPAGSTADHEALRLSLGVPDGARDMADGLLLENGYDELRAIDWKKGCYVGQEVTARMRYRGLARKRLVPVRIEGPPPPPGAIVMLGDQEAGEMRSSAGDRGLALLRLEAIEACARDGAVLSSGEARLVPGRPAWLATEG